MSSGNANANDEALRKMLEQIQVTLAQNSRQLSLVRAQRTAKERERRGVELTRQAVEAEGSDAKVWRGVGKMFCSSTPSAVVANLTSQEKAVTEEVDVLGKKQKFLEKQIADTQGHLRDFLRGVEGQQSKERASAAAS